MNLMLDNFFELDEKILKMANQAEKECEGTFKIIDETLAFNEAKVLSAFIKNGVSESHFSPSTGYGYGDRGREVLDSVFADIVGAQDALVRHNFVSGTHALTVALFGVLRPNDVLVAVTSKPYDTMEKVIGVNKNDNAGSLIDFGVKYKQIELDGNQKPDIEAIKKSVVGAKVCYIQRSCGYSLRPSITVDEIGEIAKQVKLVNKDIIVIVDNCYGEFVEKKEPTQIGADLIVGSLIKNPGGAIAETGGYIAGRKDLIELCANRLTSPGMGKEVGCTLNQTKKMLMGLFFAPSVVANALKVSIFSLKFFENLGFEVFPKYNEYRTDIISAIKLGNEKRLISFCKGIQKGSPVDAFVSPEPWDMPGYNSKVIMAAGAFTMGASIELSADAPLKEPYAVWIQGGITYNSGKIGVLTAANNLLKERLLEK
jgi:cystathionine beta-lyase family protein involved in aluminum resistance